jgi:Divergent polysaccharide deacetylase
MSNGARRLEKSFRVCGMRDAVPQRLQRGRTWYGNRFIRPSFATQLSYALAIGHPHPTTIEALSEWLPSLRARGFVLVPASALLRMEAQGAG